MPDLPGKQWALCARLWLAVMVTLCTPLAARAADPQAYRVEFASTGDGAMDSTLRATSELIALREQAPVGPFGLVARARGEVDRLKTVVESYGYYQSTVTIKIQGMNLNSPELADALAALPKGQDARVAISFELGPLYHIGRITLDGEIPDSAKSAFTLKSGDPAVAANVLAAGARVQSTLQDQGYAFAKVDAPVAYEDPALPQLDVTFHVAAGARVKIGDIRLQGLQRVHEKLVRRRLLVHSGEIYNPTAIEAARRDLLTLGVFASISVQVGDAADARGDVPITFVLHERLRHAVSLNTAYSSDLGGSGGATWTDRNVFGNAEQLNLAASLINVGGSSTTGLGYDTTAKLTIPDFGHRDQSLQVAVGAIKQSLQAYDRKAITSGVTLTRKLSSVWSASGGVSTADEQIEQERVDYHYTLVALPLTVNYDSTHLASPLDDPVHGMRDSLSVTPTLALGHPDSRFVIVQVQAAAYVDLHFLGFTDAGRSVLAMRALAGQALGAGEFSLPPDQRFYAGGSGTIRGYKYQAVGPEFCLPTLPKVVRGSAPLQANVPTTGAPCVSDGNPIGGTAIAAGSLEFRQRVLGNFGTALFVDAGQVSASLKPLPSDFRVGYGAGLRYYTPIGPIRFDVALPTRRLAAPNNDAFEIYVGLGQAF